MRSADSIRRSNYDAILLALFAVVPLALAQNAAPIASGTTPVKPLAFEVVSIRPAKPGANPIIMMKIDPDGYRAPSQWMIYTILMAYFPQGLPYWSHRVSGAPDWVRSDLYAIDAKVSDAELADWQKQGATLDKMPMLRQMLQTMLADRCHLVAHMVPGTPITGLTLELGKQAPRLTETKPGETLPTGRKLPDGGVVPFTKSGEQATSFRFYNATMADLAEFVSEQDWGHPVLDHTGLTGHYDFVVNLTDDTDSNVPGGAATPGNPDPLSDWKSDLLALGLRVTPTAIPIDNLVIDHIERPSEN